MAPRPPEADDDLGLSALSGRKLAIRLLALGAVFALGVVAISTLPGLDEVRHHFADADPVWMVVTFGFELLSCLSYVAAFHAVTGRRLGLGLSYNLGMTEQAANVLVPTGGAGGPALGAVVLGRAGLPADRVAARMAALFLLTSAVSLVALLVGGVLVAVGVLTVDLPLVAGLAPAGAGAAGIAVVFAVHRFVSSPPPAEGGRLRRLVSSAVRTVLTGIDEAIALLRGGDLELVAGCVGYLAFDILALAAGFAAVGDSAGAPPVAAFVVAYVLGQLGALIPIPGGVGSTDGALIGFLVLFGASASAAAAAVFVFRVFQLGLPVVLGVIAATRLRGEVRALHASVTAGEGRGVSEGASQTRRA